MRHAIVVLYVIALIVAVVGVDLAFFKHHPWQRLAANVGIVMVFLAFFVRFLRST